MVQNLQDSYCLKLSNWDTVCTSGKRRIIQTCMPMDFNISDHYLSNQIIFKSLMHILFDIHYYHRICIR